MLVLSRKHKQKIIINDNIEITILKTNGKQIKIGIEAPKDVSIYREEVYPGSVDNTLSTKTSANKSLRKKNSKAGSHSSD